MDQNKGWQRQGEWTIKPAGDSALLIELPQQIELAANRKIHGLAKCLEGGSIDGILDLVPGYCTLLIQYDPLVVSYRDMVEKIQASLSSPLAAEDVANRVVEIPTVYGGEYGPDLTEVAEINYLEPDEVIRIHSQGRYFVYMMGFTPGFPYLGGLDSRIATPRLATPRTSVPAGAVGIAGDQTGIYSINSDGAL